MMILAFFHVALRLAAGGLDPGPAPGDPLPVRLDGPGAGPHYVGQAIPVRVLVTAGAEEPAVEPPSHPAVDVIATGRDVRPITGGAIGAVVHETNVSRFDFALVPRRAGRLVVPAFRARAGDRSGSGGPIRLDPIAPPAFGRPAWFLGGVGPVEVELIARPEAIRLGESAVVTILLKGPGALGSTARPTLRGTDGSALPADVTPMPMTSAAEPPTRAFPFRVRPREAGTLRLAPVLVAWFDPASRQYQTVGSRGLSIRVDDPPPFDPGVIEVAALDEPGPSDRPWGWRAGVGIVLAAATAVGGAGLAGLARRLARSRGLRARCFAARQARRLRSGHGVERAGRATAALAGYLRRAIGRPEGELTPPEARRAIAEATGDGRLADRAAALVAACDAIRFSGREPRGASSDGLEDAAALLRDLARSRVRRLGARTEAEPSAGRGPTDRRGAAVRGPS